MARIVGPGIAGLVIAWFGESPLFFLNAISFIPVIAGLAMIDVRKLHARSQKQLSETPRQSTWQSLREGFVYIWRTPAALLIIAVVGTVSLFGINFNVVLPLFAADVLHAGAAGFGFISSAFGLGSLLSALCLAWGNKLSSMRRMLISMLVFCVLEALFAISPWYPLSLVLIAMVGFSQIAFSTVANSTLQTVTPDHLRGRIMSVYMLVFAGSIPLGNLFTGASLRSTSLLTGWRRAEPDRRYRRLDTARSCGEKYCII
jgi:MFS family permease